MPNHTQLRDLYRFGGFLPEAHIHGLFGDPFAVVIPLRRVSKKHSAESVARPIEASTIKPLGTSAISRPADDVSICVRPSDASSAECARP
jgi:hypothetical protein